MPAKILQINVNHSRVAQDRALATAAKVGANIILVSEPHCRQGIMSPTPGWKRSTRDFCAILVGNEIHAEPVQVESKYMAAATIGDVLLISVYLSPNYPAGLELDRLRTLQAGSLKTIIGGDFNCRWPAFSTLQMRPRDEEFRHFVEDEGLLLNNSDAPT